MYPRGGGEAPPGGGLGGGNANFLSLNIYFTLSFMLARFFWLLQFFVLGVFTEKIAILVENALFQHFVKISRIFLLKAMFNSPSTLLYINFD